VLAEDRRIGLPKLYRTYTTWCSEGGLQPFSARRFNRRLRDHFRGRWTCGRSPGRAPGSASSSARTRRYLGGDRADVAGVPGPAETDEGDRDGHATRTGARPPYRWHLSPDRLPAPTTPQAYGDPPSPTPAPGPARAARRDGRGCAA